MRRKKTPSQHGRQGFELLTCNFDLCTGAVTLRVIGISEILGELVVSLLVATWVRAGYHCFPHQKNSASPTVKTTRRCAMSLDFPLPVRSRNFLFFFLSRRGERGRIFAMGFA